MHVRKEELVKIIRECLGSESEEDSEDIASYLLNIFGFNNGIADTLITNKDRMLFNYLFDLGILKIRKVSLGNTCMIHIRGSHYFIDEIAYWFLEPEKKKEHIKQNKDIYDSLPDEAWERKYF